MTIQTYRPSTRRASRKQLRLLDHLMQSRAHSPEDRADYAAWLRDQPTTEQASRRIDEAYARINDPEHRAKAQLADGLDRLSRKCDKALSKHEKPSGIIDHAAEAQHIAQQLRQREGAAQAQDEADCEGDRQPSPEEVDEMAEEYAARADWEAEAQQKKPQETTQGRFTTVDVPLVEGAAELWDC